MRKEYVNFPENIPVKVFFTTIKEYPFHWHNCIEIIYVLKGSINIFIESGNYELTEGEVEIINTDEAHRLFSTKDNKVLIFQFDTSFFEKYYNDIEDMYFYTNTTDEGAQNSDEYDELRTYLSIILCEFVQKQDDYDKEIEDTLVELLYHLINNFHYLIYEQEELKDNEEQLERYHRIAKYIYNNYNSKISLQDIAKKEFLSTHYLSHEIKYTLGYSFTDMLNQTRVEESIKLLLDTDKTISEISEEVGFSHTRYFNKHFKIHFKCSPTQFRKKYKVDDELLEKHKKLTYLDIKESLDFLQYYLQSYDRFNYKNKIVKVNINMDKDEGKFDTSFKKIITVGDAFDLLMEDNKDVLSEIQEEIGFEYGRILNTFSIDMAIFPSSEFYNWNRAKSVLQFLEDIDLKPLIVLNNKDFDDEEFVKILKSFLMYFSEQDYPDMCNFEFQFEANLSQNLQTELKKVLLDEYNLPVLEEYFYACEEIDPIYDTTYMVPFIIHNVINNDNNNLEALRAFDVLDNQINLTNEVFLGYPGLINDMAIKKPSYYAYYLLNKLGDTLVAKGDSFIATKSHDEFQILLYNYKDTLDSVMKFEDLLKMSNKKSTMEKKISLNIINISSDVRMSLYEINEKVGSSFNYWRGMGSPITLSKEEKEILYKASFPKINFKYAKKSSVLNIVTELKGYGATLILIKKISKHL